MGAVLYELLTRSRAFARPNPVDTLEAIRKSKLVPVETYRPDIPPLLAVILHKMLRPNQRERHANCRELSEELRGFLADRPAFSPTDAATFMRDLFDGAEEAERRTYVGGDGDLPTVVSSAGVSIDGSSPLEPTHIISAPEPFDDSDEELTLPDEEFPSGTDSDEEQLAPTGPVKLELEPTSEMAGRKGRRPKTSEPATPGRGPRRSTFVVVVLVVLCLAVGIPVGARLLSLYVRSDGELSTPDGFATRMIPNPSGSERTDGERRSGISGRRRAKKKPVGKIKLRSEPVTRVLLDGRAVGNTPLELTAPVGRHEVVLTSRKDGIRRAFVLDVTKGGTAERVEKFGRGSVIINSEPYSKIFLRGESLGHTPKVVEVYEGTHVFRLVSGRTEIKRTVVVGTGERAKIDEKIE